jgi:hypothetical protein
VDPAVASGNSSVEIVKVLFAGIVPMLKVLSPRLTSSVSDVSVISV